ncbi:MAG: CAP domain-containing protein [Chloroflexi bacterium]|nr:CAP domain-containing protein [Chloroflexota bacterium]
MRRALVGLAPFVAIAVIVLTVGSQHGHAGPNCTANSDIDSEERALLTLLNDYRADRGLSTLVMSETLNRAAAWKAQHMASNGYLEHDDLGLDRTFDDRLRDCGYGFNTRKAENIAAGNETGAATFAQWREDAAHDAIMLDPAFHAIGIGRAFDGASLFGWYWTTEFGGVVDAAPTTLPFSLNRSAMIAEFIIPGVPVAATSGVVPDGASLPAPLTVRGSNVAAIFPPSGELLLGGTELIVYNTSSCADLSADQVCVTQRAKVGTAKVHPDRTRVQVATQLTAAINGDNVLNGDAVECDLAASVSATAQPPFAIQCSTGAAAAFGKTGFVTINHSGTVLGLSTEYMQYNNNDPGCTLAADQLCIFARALQPGNDKRAHLANGFRQPCVTNNALTCSPAGVTQGTSRVHKHFQISVKSNTGFFATGPLMVYSVDAANTIVGAEILNYNNAADKIKMPGATEFHIIGRGGTQAALQPTTISSHAANSIVTGAHTNLVCRTGQVQPGVDIDLDTPGVQEPIGQMPGTSVAVYPVCYARTQPGDGPKTLNPEKLNVPIVSSLFMVLNAFSVPFLSTGGLTSTILGDTPLVDANGPNDGQLILVSPCILGFAPGVNLSINVNTRGLAGSIHLVVDTIPNTTTGGPDRDPATHDDCDDPPLVADIDLILYSFYDPTLPEGAGTCNDTLDNDGDFKADIDDPDCYSLSSGAVTHDTDGDGCSDVEELNPNFTKGGLRDPWNPFDYYDVNGDGDIDVPNDILQVILAYLQGPGDPQYTAAKDRGGTLGPFAHNRAEPDQVIDVPNDILQVILQFQQNCQGGP